MQEAEILDATRRQLSFLGIAASATLDGSGNVVAIGTGNGKMVSMKVTGTTETESIEQIAARGADLAQQISVQMAGL